MSVIVIDVGCQEEWRPWVACYDVSSIGRIRNRTTGLILKPTITKRSKHHRGHWRISVRVDGRYRQAYVHTAVLEAFVGPRPEGKIARHLNDVKDDNRVENLAWGTVDENYADAVANGCYPRGERAANARLNETQVREILRSRDTQQSLADRYGVARTTIQSIKRRDNWKWVTV